MYKRQIPIYGRSADNIRDHRNVTSMLHRIRTKEYGVTVKPTMSFDERGHRKNDLIYFVMGVQGNGESPVSFYPTVDSFIGEGGTFTHPKAVYEKRPGMPCDIKIDGKEAMGGIRFKTAELGPDDTAEYSILMGITENETEADRITCKYHSGDAVVQALSLIHISEPTRRS